MTRTIYYVMKCYHLTGDGGVIFFSSKDQMHRAYESMVNPILKALTTHNLLDEEDDLWNYTNSNNPNDTTWGGFRLNGGQNEIMDELFTPEGVNVYYQWGMVEVEITTEQLYYICRFSEYVDESTIEFVNGLGLAQSKYDEYVTEHLDIARMHEGWTIDRTDKDTWGSSVMHGTLFDEQETNGYKQAFFGYCDVTETIRLGDVAFDPVIIIDQTGSTEETNRRLTEHILDMKNIFGNGKQQPEVKLYVAFNPNNEQMFETENRIVLGIYSSEDIALGVVKDSMTENFWNNSGLMVDQFVEPFILNQK